MDEIGHALMRIRLAVPMEHRHTTAGIRQFYQCQKQHTRVCDAYKKYTLFYSMLFDTAGDLNLD